MSAGAVKAAVGPFAGDQRAYLPVGSQALSTDRVRKQFCRQVCRIRPSKAPRFDSPDVRLKNLLRFWLSGAPLPRRGPRYQKVGTM